MALMASTDSGFARTRLAARIDSTARSKSKSPSRPWVLPCASLIEKLHALLESREDAAEWDVYLASRREPEHPRGPRSGICEAFSQSLYRDHGRASVWRRSLSTENR